MAVRGCGVMCPRAVAPLTTSLTARGNLVSAVTLDGDRRVVGFGRGSVYMISFDELDLAYLEKYALPE